MRLRNKKTGQEGNFIINKDHFECVDLDYVPEYRNLAELNAEWEDASEEPKGYWYYDTTSNRPDFIEKRILTEEDEESDKQIGNHFATREEAEKAVEKLKAWKRLRDKGFFFDGRTPVHDNTVRIRARVGVPFLTDELTNDLDLLFGGEE